MNMFRGLKFEPDISAAAAGEAAFQKEIGEKDPL